MNKFVAMLRDSYKEAVDGWIFLVMMILSAIVILIVGSMSFDPVPAETAIPRTMTDRTGGVQSAQYVSADRGQAPKIALFLYRLEMGEVRVISPRPDPWESEIQFTLDYMSSGMGPSGVEVDDVKKPDPKTVKQIEGGLFSDAFKEAVRYWAGKPGEKNRPKYTDELGAEFVAQQVREIARLDVKSVEKVKGQGNQFLVTTQGGSRLGWSHKPSLFFGLVPMSFLESPLGQLVHLLEDTMINGIGAWVVLLAGVIVTAGFIPNMLRKGAIDLLLTKPMSRPLILVFKYFGGLLFVFMLTAVTVGGVWLAIGVRTGVWSPGLLYCIGGITFYFAILYACSTFVGVLTRNAIVSIVVTIVFWFLVWLIGTIHGALTLVSNMEMQRERPSARKEADKKPEEKTEEAEPATEGAERGIPKGLINTFKVLNAMTPRTKDLDALTTKLIGEDLLSPADQRQAGFKVQKIEWGEVIGVAVGYILLFLALAMVRFVTRSY